ncbi:HD domain-containing protein [Bacillus sp. BRMEA1]|uniref:HD-GYP domain-containing protein n=1 Tax=Neobacillus endophyticus TaxID=2738405 RepID=UPI001566D15C|nr:HD-GYP domain-containing protein [Neobacillus endophyticus]NRD78036.1 HD domain-containing protein [Neobacillus endophyticus]
MIIHEEQRAIKWFLLVFYIILFSYDFFYYFFAPVYVTHRKVGFPSHYWYFTYFILILLIPVMYYLNKRNKQAKIKYVLFITYLITVFIIDVLTYYKSTLPYTSGNMVEVFLILSLPIFLNRNFFWLVSSGLTIKYFLIGITLHSTYVIMPILLIITLAIMSFFLLVRFQGYVKAISESYDKQLQGIVKGVIATLELKDPYTRGHSERVANYAILLEKELGKFKKEEQKSFFYSCLLHDIGKVHIPDSILMKPGKLTEEEYKIIKSHPVVGADAVKNVDELRNSLSVIRSHHERWDGKGYPDQLKGDEIPFPARIVAIADAFDAMTSSRSYRGAMPVEEAYNRILEGQGSQFDPMLVEEFKKVFPTWVKFHEEYPWNKKWELLREVEK